MSEKNSKEILSVAKLLPVPPLPISTRTIHLLISPNSSRFILCVFHPLTLQIVTCIETAFLLVVSGTLPSLEFSSLRHGPLMDFSHFEGILSFISIPYLRQSITVEYFKLRRTNQIQKNEVGKFHFRLPLEEFNFCAPG